MTLNSTLRSFTLAATILIASISQNVKADAVVPNLDDNTQPPQCEKPWGKTKEDSTYNVRKYFFFQSAIKVNNYEQAYEHWQYVMTTIPCARKTPYDIAPDMFDTLIFKADSARKEVLFDSLMDVFPQRIKYFGEEGYVKGQWAVTYMKHKPKDFKAAFDLFKESVEMEKGKTGYDIPIPYFQTAYKMFLNKQLTKEEVIEVFVTLSKVMDENIAKNNEEHDTWIQVAGYINQLVGRILTCEDIVTLFDQKLKDNPEDMQTRTTVIKLMKVKKCNDNPMYFRVLEELIKIQPDEQSFEELSNFFHDKGDYAKANKYLLKAVELSTNEEKKLVYYLKLANNSLKVNCADARKYADKALGLNPNSGQAIIIKGHAIYRCTVAACSDAFEKKAASWIAVDYMRKAIAADPSVAESANAAIASYRKGYPSKDDKFFRNLKDGESYTLPCVGITTTVK
jgi:hypothetical protein